MNTFRDLGIAIRAALAAAAGGALIVLTVGALRAQTPPGADRPGAAIDDVRVQDPTAGVSLELLQQYSEEGDFAGLIRLLQEGNNKIIRGLAAAMLSAYREPTVIEALTAAIQDPEEWVRTAAIDALAYIGGEDVAEPLRIAVLHPDPVTAETARDAIPQAAAGAPLAVATVARGSVSARDQAGWVEVDDAERWRELWDEHSPGTEAPAVDFSKEKILAVFLGPQAGPGAFLEIERVEEVTFFVRAIIRQSRPAAPPEGAEEAKLPHPFHIVRFSTDLPGVHTVRIFAPDPASG